MNGPLISIIVPVFNVEDYIENCVDSIMNQSYKNLEIILINDGSNDRSPWICDNLSKKYSNLSTYHKTNGGVSSARNYGIDVSTGDYITFIDSDDQIAPNYIQCLYKNLISSDSEIAVCQINYTSVPTDKNILQESTEKVFVMNSVEAMTEMLYQRQIINGVFAKLYARRLFENNRFNEKLTYAEDLEFSYALLRISRTISVSSLSLYNYNQRLGSAMNIKFNEKRMDGLRVTSAILRDVSKTDNVIVYNAARNRYFMEAYYILINIFASKANDNINYQECIKVIKKLRKHVLFDNNSRLKFRIIALISYINCSLAARLSQLGIKFRRSNLLNDSKVYNTKKMRVMIITLSLGTNYGGLLQAYALQQKLFVLGYDVSTNLQKKNVVSLYNLARYIKRMMRHQVRTAAIYDINSNFAKKVISINTIRFIDKNMKTFDMHEGKQKIPKHNINKFDAIVVGSDQVWRKAYSNIPEYLLDFTKDMNIKRISYAASFGKDDLSEYGDDLIKSSAILANRFDAISVREDTGVEICKKYWGVGAIQVVDPTLLLDKADYNKLITNDSEVLKPSNGKIFAYILDKDSNKQSIVDHLSKVRKQKTFDIMPPKPISKKELNNNPEKYVLPHVTQWLKSFADADFVVTDSFHGCVFSIIYNKPFIAIGNKNRGLTRFTSLLKVFNLEDRLVTNNDNLQFIINQKIDWNEVNSIRAKEKIKSLEFLRTNLQGAKPNKASP